jgi:radical SAM superfamily enzyme YgiQ (UPF0313 family)
MKKQGVQKRVEIGTIKKDWGGRTPVALVYPNSYYVGMSNLAIHLFYKHFNDDPKMVAERIFLSDKISSEESNRPIEDFKAALFTFSFETDYLNIPKIFGNNIPLTKEKRGESLPLLIAGGPAVTLNPSALSEIFDALVVGEAEDILGEISLALKNGGTKEECLEKLSAIKGVLVPGTKPKQIYTKDLNLHPVNSVIWTDDTEFGQMHLVEVARGCPWKCKYCATPPLYRPYRIRKSETIWQSIEYGLPHRNHIGLIGSDVLGHPDFEEIANELISRGIKVSTSSLRVDRISKNVAEILKRAGHKRTTLGIEAGTEHMRTLIGKKLSDKSILNSVKNLSGEGITNLKLYFMIGLPGEKNDDIKGIAELTGEIRKVILAERKEKTLAPNISLVVTPFVPKKSTSFENEKFAGTKYLNSALKKLRSLINKIPNTKISGESPKQAEIEYKLSHIGPKELVRNVLNS